MINQVHIPLPCMGVQYYLPIHTIKEPEEMDLTALPAKGLLEFDHELNACSVSRRKRILPSRFLEGAEGFPGEMNHFLIPSGEQTD